MAFAQGTALAAFFVAFQSGTLWLFWPGAAFSFFGFVIAAPTSRRFESRDQRLYAAMLEVG